MKNLTLCFIVCIVATSLSAANIRDAKVNSIVDANTIIVKVIPQVDFNSSLKNPKTVKLYGIYTPPDMTVATEGAINYLNRQLLGQKVTVYVEKDLEKNSVVGRVRAPQIRDVSEELIKLGFARRKDDGGKYKKEEERAQKKELGLWADIDQNKSKDENLYNLNDSGVKEFDMYKLKLSGYDAFYKIGTGPNKYLVYHKDGNGKVLKHYILVGVNPHRIDVLRNGDYDEIVVQSTGKQGIRFPSGNVKYFPVLKVVGKNTVHGVGGELMYYR